MNHNMQTATSNVVPHSPQIECGFSILSAVRKTRQFYEEDEVNLRELLQFAHARESGDNAAFEVAEECFQKMTASWKQHESVLEEAGTQQTSQNKTRKLRFFCCDFVSKFTIF